MISIVTAYYNRKNLLIRTLDSLKFSFGRIDFEFIAVDDGSKEDERLEDLVVDYPFLRVHRINPDEKWYLNPCIPFNIGIELAKGDKIILQNPECYHFDNILEYVDSNLAQNVYLSFGCFSLDKENTDVDKLFYNRLNIENLINQFAHVVEVDGGLGWYNHSRYRSTSYHFCTAIMSSDLVDLGGFDPRYALGHGYDDDELIYRIRLKRMKIRFVDDLIVLHQNHYVKQLGQDDQKLKYLNERAFRNKVIFETITKNNSIARANFIRINKFEPKISYGIVSRIKKSLAQIYRKLFQ